jgi:hypothetical protein
LESSLSLEELLTTLKAVRDREDRERVFLAGINGIDMQEKQEEEVQDVSDLNKNFQAKKEGFGINEGLGFMSLEG